VSLDRAWRSGWSSVVSRRSSARASPSVTLHHRVVSPARERMAAQQSRQRLPASAENPVAFHGFLGIVGTGRHKAAGRRQQRRDRPLVGSQHFQDDEFGELEHKVGLQAFGVRRPESLLVPLATSGSAPALPASFPSITTKARHTSFTTSAKSMTSKDFFGLMTTSAPTSPGKPQSRTASRNRRFMRLRCTAPPRARPTVNPMRGPEVALRAASASGRSK
jgi:hypothetical protein